MMMSTAGLGGGTMAGTNWGGTNWGATSIGGAGTSFAADTGAGTSGLMVILLAKQQDFNSDANNLMLLSFCPVYNQIHGQNYTLQVQEQLNIISVFSWNK